MRQIGGGIYENEFVKEQWCVENPPLFTSTPLSSRSSLAAGPMGRVLLAGASDGAAAGPSPFTAAISLIRSTRSTPIHYPNPVTGLPVRFAACRKAGSRRR